MTDRQTDRETDRWTDLNAGGEVLQELGSAGRGEGEAELVEVGAEECPGKPADLLTLRGQHLLHCRKGESPAATWSTAGRELALRMVGRACGCGRHTSPHEGGNRYWGSAVSKCLAHNIILF